MPEYSPYSGPISSQSGRGRRGGRGRPGRGGGLRRGSDRGVGADGRRVRPGDEQDTIGNSGLTDQLDTAGPELQEEREETPWALGAGMGLGQEEEQAAATPDLREGSTYMVAGDDMASGEGEAWEKIARDHGMQVDVLVAFNQQVRTVRAGAADEHTLSPVTALAIGTTLYIPSADDILFAQCSHKSGGDLDAATSLFNGLAADSNLAILRTARERASGQVGVGYGTSGDGGVFYTQNDQIAGASNRRTSELGGEKQYRVNWGVDFWKCSVFMHDVVYSAGYKPDMTENNHYRLAGQLQWSDDYAEVNVGSAAPGMAWQRFGGTRSNESHNAILSSFVIVEDVNDEYEQWTFSIIGAESERAAESTRTHMIKKGTNENQEGKKIRFFKPKQQR